MPMDEGKGGNSMGLPIRLREVRELRGFSQTKLGRIAGCRQDKICSYETGKSMPQLDTLMRLADILQAPIDYLVGRTDEMERKTMLTDVLSEDEIDLILKYRGLPPEKKLKLSGIVIGLSE